jgi:hypothetical protein
MASQLALTLPQQPSLRVLLPDPEAQQQAATRLGILQMIFDYKNDPTRFGSLKLKDGKKVKSYSRMVEYASEASYASETGGVTVRSTAGSRTSRKAAWRRWRISSAATSTAAASSPPIPKLHGWLRFCSWATGHSLRRVAPWRMKPS